MSIFGAFLKTQILTKNGPKFALYLDVYCVGYEGDISEPRPLQVATHMMIKLVLSHALKMILDFVFRVRTPFLAPTGELYELLCHRKEMKRKKRTTK